MSLCIQANACHHNLKDNVLNEKMASKDKATGVIFLSPTVIGLLGNFSILYHYFFSIAH
jgi:hypothetical protein